MTDAFTPCEKGLEEFQQKLGIQHARLLEFLNYDHQLRMNIRQVRQDGDTPSLSAERPRIIRQLNALALETVGVSFNALCSPASRGFIALIELMQTPDVQAAVVTFQTDFQAACKQIEVVSCYKDMHDLLHTLQFQCYNLIVQEARRFPDDEKAQDILTDHELTLQEIVHRLRNVAGRASFATDEVSAPI